MGFGPIVTQRGYVIYQLENKVCLEKSRCMSWTNCLFEFSADAGGSVRIFAPNSKMYFYLLYYKFAIFSFKIICYWNNPFGHLLLKRTCDITDKSSFLSLEQDAKRIPASADNSNKKLVLEASRLFSKHTLFSNW